MLDEDKVKAAEDTLTDWKNEPSIADLKSDYTSAQSDVSEHITDVQKWLDNYDGKRTFKVKKGHSKVVPKLIRKQAEWRYAALSEPFLSTDSIFKIEPVTFEDKDAAVQNELVLNNQFNTKLNKTDFIDEYVRTAVDEGTVVVKTGWEYDEKVETITVPEFEYTPMEHAELAQREQEIEQLRQSNPREYEKLPVEVKQAHEFFMEDGVPYVPTQIGTTEEEKVTILTNKPTVEICEYDKLTIDPTCKGDVKKAQFIIHEFESTMSDLKKDKRYKNLDSITETASDALINAETDPDTSFTFNDAPRKKLTVYEYWGFYDIDGTGIVKPFRCSWIGDTKVRMELNPFPDEGLPFVKVVYLPVRKKNFGQPDGYLLEDNQKVIGAVTRGLMDMMGRNAAGQKGIRKDALDVTNKLKYDRGDDYEFNPQIDPNSVAHVHEFPNIPNSAMDMVGFQNAEAESLTGVKAYSQGISGQALGSVATSVRGALDAASKRELGILRRLADGIVQIGRKIIAMNSEFLEEKEVVRITNDQFVEVDRDDLAGNFDLKLSISTAESDNEKAQELSFMLQTTGPGSDPGEVRMIRAEIARLRKMPELAKRIEEYQPQPDPLAVKKAELEIQLLEAQIFNERAQGEENSVDVQLKKAKTATEEAKARAMHSTSDKTDLDFVEQRNGEAENRENRGKDQDRLKELDLKAADSMLNADKDNESDGFLSDFKL